MKHYDVIVIGSGPGGYVAAQRCGEGGKRVLLIERDHLGGVCTNWGCIPTKSLLHAAKLYVHAKHAHQFGIHVKEVSFDLAQAMAWKEETVNTLRSGIAYLMKQSRVEVITGEAVCRDASHVQVGEELFSCDDLIIATGSTSAPLPVPGSNQTHVLTSDGMLELKKVPRRLAVIGGGVIGLEFASLYASLGAEVHVIEMLDEILPMADSDCAKTMRRAMKEITFHLGCRVNAIDGKTVSWEEQDGKSGSCEAEVTLVSTGRCPNLTGIDGIGLDITQGAVAVDNRMRTNIPRVYAVGDVTGRSLLAHSASAMAETAVASILGKPRQMRWHAVPWAVYSLPEAAGCGLTESEARKLGIDVQTASVQLRSNGRFLAEHGKKAPGICKVVIDLDRNLLAGVHLVGSAASEIIWGAAALIEAELRPGDIREIIFPHPTVSESIRDALYALDDADKEQHHA